MPYYELCNRVAKAVEKAVLPLIGKPEAKTSMGMGADGTVTEKIDKVAEDAALSILESDGRSIRLVSEELGEKIIGNNPEFTFVLDPVDGTFNAVNNIPFFCVPVAIGNADLSDTRYGYVKNLVNGDVYTAQKGHGAFLNNKRIHVSSRSGFPEMSFLSYTHHPYAVPANNHRVRRVRIFGSAALELCYIASGIFDAFIDMREMLRVTDIAAGKLIVEEAGGTVTDGRGAALRTPLDVKQRLNLVASNGLSHDKLLELV
ncbi:MAG: bifunctional fructose-bisphosphatase/inositol-phosphate phosphatase [Candidatus Methanoperedens sp.]|jgi:myo-inositol-1(or 4)-monophosphatase|nr:bifunctional fructose-bisphosphatase/inositol-phosphate phosphatase [Candidatus Methanoperedens sp.]PKL53055.1 MAG: D-fructose 1,6-bisphosphatase [Candidatus Methanoperedenaceae archaeon HGW-Methanoperedenaceae-1]